MMTSWYDRRPHIHNKIGVFVLWYVDVFLGASNNIISPPNHLDGSYYQNSQGATIVVHSVGG
jgi:hypothetical protein